MEPFKREDFELHSLGKELQKQLPYYEGLKFRQLEDASGLSYFTVYHSVRRLEERGKAASRKNEKGRRGHASIRFKGRMPISKSSAGR